MGPDQGGSVGGAAEQATVVELINSAFKHFTGAEPIVLKAAAIVDDERIATGSYDVLWSSSEFQFSYPGDSAAQVITDHLTRDPVLLCPPWGRATDSNGQFFGPSALEAHEALLIRCMPPQPDSLLGVLVPATLLTSKRANEARVKLANSWQSLVIIHFDNRRHYFPGIHQSMDLAALFLGGSSYTDTPLKMFQVPSSAKPGDVVSDFKLLLKQRGGRTRFGYIVRERIAPGEELNFERRDPNVLSRRTDLTSFGPVQPLEETFTILATGVRLGSQTDFCESNREGAVRVITGRDIRRDGSITSVDDESRWICAPNAQHLRPGDVVLRAIQHPTDAGGLVVAEVTANDLPAITDDNVIALRPKQAKTHEHQLFTMLYLRSSLARTLLRASSLGGALRISRAALAQLDIPQPDVALAEAMENLIDAAEKMRLWQVDALALLNAVFLDESAAQSRARMLQSGRTLRLRAEAASLLDDFSYTARTRFPHPVAYRWRVMEALISSGASQDAYRSILDVAETLLCYAAHLAFVLARSASADLSQQNELRKKLAKGRSGGGMGEWIAVLREVSQAKAVRSLPSTEPLAEFRVTFSASDVDQAINSLFDRRNSNYHQRSIDDLDLPDEITDAKTELLTLMNGAAFLCDLPLVYITSFRWDSLLQRSSLTYRELMGDHPVVAVRSRTYDQQGIEEGSLYVAEANGRLHLLRPFLIGQTCPKCRNWSTFHVDSVMRNHVTRFKCLERGHTMRQPTPTDALSAVGLL